MTIHQLDEAIAHQYDTGRCSTLGADGGVLRYILVNINGTYYNASITLDHDVAKIRRIWALREVTAMNKPIKDIYDFTREYYSVMI